MSDVLSAPVGIGPRVVDGPGEPGLVSVIIPSYNRAYILPQAIESVLGQTHQPVEVIVADDGSTDDTREVVARFGPQVRYAYQVNAGVGAARNLGLRHARGEFVALLDSDDHWLPWKLAAQIALLRRFPDLGMVWSDMTAVDAQGAVIEQTHLRTMYSAHREIRIESVLERRGAFGELWTGAPADLARCAFYSGDLFSQMMLGNLVHTSTVLLRRERVARSGGFDDALRPTGEDYEFHLRTSSYGPVGFLDAPTILYRIGEPDQLTGPGYGVFTARNNLRTLSRWLGHAGQRITLPRAVMDKRLADALVWLGDEELHVGRPGVARAHLWRSLRLRPRGRTAFLLASAMLPRALFDSLRRARAALRHRRRAATLAPEKAGAHG